MLVSLELHTCYLYFTTYYPITPLAIDKHKLFLYNLDMKNKYVEVISLIILAPLISFILIFGYYFFFVHPSESDNKQTPVTKVEEPEKTSTYVPASQPTPTKTAPAPQPTTTKSTPPPIPTAPQLNLTPPPDTTPVPRSDPFQTTTPTSPECKPIIMQGQNTGLYECPRF